MNKPITPKVKYAFSGLPLRFSKFKRAPWFMYVGFMLDLENNTWMKQFIQNYKDPALLRDNHQEVMYWFCEKINQCYNSDIIYCYEMLNFHLKQIESVKRAHRAFTRFMDIDRPTGAMIYAKLRYMKYEKYMLSYEKEQLFNQEEDVYYEDKQVEDEDDEEQDDYVDEEEDDA